MQLAAPAAINKTLSLTKEWGSEAPRTVECLGRKRARAPTRNEPTSAVIQQTLLRLMGSKVRRWYDGITLRQNLPDSAVLDCGRIGECDCVKSMVEVQ